MKALKIAVVALVLTACGTASDDDKTDSGSDGATTTTTTPSTTVPTTTSNSSAPDYSGWSREPNATNSCLAVNEDGMNCTTEFTAADDNDCGDATFKFIAIENGYMYVQTKLHVIVRHNQPHTLSFEEKPEIYKLTSDAANSYYHVFICKGPNG